MSATPEMDRLRERLFGEGAPQLVNFNVFWGPKAHLLTPEERAAAINAAFDCPGVRIDDVDNYQPPRTQEGPPAPKD